MKGFTLHFVLLRTEYAQPEVISSGSKDTLYFVLRLSVEGKGIQGD